MRGPSQISLGALLGEALMSGKSEGHGVMQTTQSSQKRNRAPFPTARYPQPNPPNRFDRAEASCFPCLYRFVFA